MTKKSLILALVMFAAHSATGDGRVFSQWRGPERNGIYHETGLMQSWNENLPALVWAYEGLGAGHGSVAPGPDKLFVLGMHDTTGFIYALDYGGNLVWKSEYGTEWHINYAGSRSTPVVTEKHIFFMSGMGVVYCFEAASGKKVWKKDLLQSFDASNIQWGMAESLLILDDMLICTPGGTKHNVVALNRHNGELIWSSAGEGEPSAYCSPALITHNGTQIIVTMTAGSVIGLDALTGKKYWSVPQKQRNKIHSNTPVYSNGRIFCASENAPSENGIVSLLLSQDGRSVSIEWRNQQFQNLMGGIIVKDGFIYGSEYRRKGWKILNAGNGAVEFTADLPGSGSVIWADNRFYIYTDDGNLSLISAGTDYFHVTGRFVVSRGSGEHWAHPVIHNKRLYVRHGNAVMVYDIEEK
jgi:outer membrane protein assembly factor BamB